MIKVLHCLGSLNRGGIETFIMNVYRAINRTEFQFDFLVSNGGDYEEEIKSLGGHVYKIPSRNTGFFQYSRNVDLFFYNHKDEYAAIHVHAATLSSLEVLVSAKKYDIAIRIIHSHSSTVKTSKLHYLFHYWNKMRIAKLATHYLACSTKAATWFFSGTSVSKKIAIIRNGVNPVDFSFSPKLRDRILQDFDIDDHTFVVGHVGSMIKVKNHSYLLNIYNEIYKLIPDSKLLLVGDGPLRSLIEQQILKLGLKDNVLLLGSIDNVNELLQAIDVIVMPSIFEGMPVSLIEAQASGCLVVCSDTISSDTKILSSFTQISLKDTPKHWAEVIISKATSNKRNDTRIEIQKSGFSIYSVIELLMKIYNS